MGVSGSGKSTVGRALAARLRWRFADGDAFHPAANIAKMREGQPLDDSDREPWLAAIRARLDSWRETATPGIVACSALKRRYRSSIIGDCAGVRLVFLCGSKEVIADRLAARRGHFMPPSLLDTQFAALEAPTADESPILVEIDQPVHRIVDQIVTALSSPAATMPVAGWHRARIVAPA
ncbi:MAG: gluconokinase [Alphaproteobacteria bacterium]|nr:gluconokinase [Alphaproteobacteria bacterium]